ncbi:MAG: ATP-binding cassette domain-containing protein [Spirochaetes bacterium]|nr:ATP-binding cassette domain-containing protein [Spirochaetota bacterium]
MIEFRNVTKVLSGVKVLNNLSFEVEKGETFVIIGRSGTGKTVTLKHIAGLLTPDEGEIFVDGERVNGHNKKQIEKIREKIGFVFQSGALINWMNVEENIALPLVEHKLYPPDEIKRIVEEKMDLLQLTSARDKMPAEISGGMKKRASLARVLVRNPEIILYDEPTAGLDPVMSSLINTIIIQLKKDFKITQVVVTHDMDSAYAIADRIAMLYDGTIIQCDVPEGIRNTKNPIVRQFITGSLEGPIEVL